jgi:hypothetical protein
MVATQHAIILQDIILNLLSGWVHSVCSVMIKLDVKALPRLWLYSRFRPAVKALADLSPEYVYLLHFPSVQRCQRKLCLFVYLCSDTFATHMQPIPFQLQLLQLVYHVDDTAHV